MQRMGGCCCCPSRNSELTRSSALFHHAPLSSHNTAISALSGGLLVNTNLDTSVPDTYRAPPAPVPFETTANQSSAPLENAESPEQKTKLNSQSSHNQPVEESNPGSTKIKSLDPNERADIDVDLDLTKKCVDLKKPTESMLFQDEEDVCPTCLEEYNAENPKILTKCDHHFHLACILEWMERSNACPVCDQEMVYSPHYAD